MSQALLWDKITLYKQILEGNMGKLKNNVIITIKSVSPGSGLIASLPLSMHSQILGPYMIIISV